ncbi:MAG TPA: hypothetical protein VFA48_00650 [Gammaproteobacteria bacterium]|nr:hypothetical protein [Gammaproteobacteria bacterium]
MNRSKLTRKASNILFLAVFLPAFATTAFAAINGQDSHANLSRKTKSGEFKALAELRRDAAKGNVAAERNLGERYATGHGVKQKDYAQAAAWLMIARLGSNNDQHGSSTTLAKLQARMTMAQIAEAWNRVGVLYATGQARKPGQTRVDHWFRKAAKAGNADAQYTLGRRYQQGHGRVQSNALAVRYFLDAAAQGEPRALDALRSMAGSGVGEAETALGWLYANGNGVTRDYTKAYSWWHKAATQSDPVAQVNLGSLYESGSGVDRDYTKAAHWYRKAAELGDTTAQVKLGMLYTSGHGVAQNYRAAAGWFKKAARNGDMKAMVRLAELYANGQGVKKNPAHAATLLAQAAERGNPEGQVALGSLLAQGRVIAPNKEQAAVLFMLAKSDGNVRAKQSLAELQATLSQKQLALAKRHAEMWRTVHLVRRASQGDLAAFEALRKMANNGVTGAQVAVGSLYNAGVLMVRDFNKAAAWYRKAAAQGSANAYRNLAELYKNGQGVRKNHVKQLEYLMLAAAGGNRHASAQAAALKWKMTPTEVAEAKTHVDGLQVARNTP